jgi:hypothetical protein
MSHFDRTFARPAVRRLLGALALVALLAVLLAVPGIVSYMGQTAIMGRYDQPAGQSHYSSVAIMGRFDQPAGQSYWSFAWMFGTIPGLR